MNAKVTLTVTTGDLEGKQFIFGDRTTCTVGRSGSCYLRMPEGWAYRNISRHHCLLTIDPPTVRVRDLGSRNGTYVNGVKIGQRAEYTAPEEALATDAPEYPLREGDEVRVGDVVMRVGVASADATPEETPAESAACR